MLSKPSLWASEGSSSEGSTLRPNRSYTAFAYSFRLRRCSATSPGLGLSSRGRVQIAFHPRHERVGFGVLGTTHSGRRHHAPAQLAYHFFPGLRVLGNRRDRVRRRQCHRFSTSNCGRSAIGLQHAPVLVGLREECGRARRCRQPQTAVSRRRQRPLPNGRGSVTEPRASSTPGDDRKASRTFDDDRRSCTLGTFSRKLSEGWPCTGEHRLEEHRTSGV